MLYSESGYNQTAIIATINQALEDLPSDLDEDGFDVDIDGTLETDALSIASTTITTTAAEINLIDGDTARGTTKIEQVQRTSCDSQKHRALLQVTGTARRVR